jgi:putative acetyltransferase
MQIPLEEIIIRPLALKDNAQIAKLIRDTLAEFGANHPGTVYFDPTTDHLFELFSREGSMYNIAEWQGRVVGGCGIFPTDGLPSDTCELVKMYLLPEARGGGLGKKMISMSMQAAIQLGYIYMYLETMPELRQALKAYEKFGFEYLEGPMGNSGHFGCERWMKKRLM